MPSTTLIYDSDCGFCRWLLAKVLAWDRRGALRPVALETEEADPDRDRERRNPQRQAIIDLHGPVAQLVRAADS